MRPATSAFGSMKGVAALALVGFSALLFLYFFNPAEIRHFPRCPFLVLTGWQCPGCGTLRGLHALLHLRVLDAMRDNIFMVISIPVLALLLVFPSLQTKARLSTAILAATLCWWILRNII